MGSICSNEKRLQQNDLNNLHNNTFLKRKEILRLYNIWETLGGSYYEEPKTILSNQLVKKIYSLNKCPWAQRICFTFASQKDAGSGLCSLTFDDFINIVNAFHPRTPIEYKYYWAFKLYDFDNDGLIGVIDTHKCVRIIVGPTMSDLEIKAIVERVFNECDLDGNRELTAGEFAAVMRRFDYFNYRFTINFL